MERNTMKTLSSYILEHEVGAVSHDMVFDISLASTNHSEERTTRHGTDADNIISDDEIKEMVRRASSKIIDGLTNDRINITLVANKGNRFFIHDTYTETWIVGAVNKIQDKTIFVNVVTVYRGADFNHGAFQRGDAWTKKVYKIDL